MARLYKPFRARHSELMSQSLSSFLRQDVPASAPRAAVALQRFSPADSGAVAQALPLLLDRAGLASSFSLRSAHVLVKPNLLTATPLACTSPVVVAAVCRWLLDQGARVRVGDSPGFGTATAVARQTGVEEALRPLGLRVESLADPRPLELPLRRGGPVSFGVARVALESDVIFSLPRVKAHSQMRLTLAVKNLFGCVCGLRKALIHTRQGQDPDFFADCIAALWAGLPPVAAVADGLTAMHVTGPSKGQPFPLGLLGAAAPQLVMLAAMGLAVGSQIAGLYYAERLLELPLGLIGACLGMASLPRLSRLAGEKDFVAFRRDMALALRWATLLSLPAAAGLWAVGPCLVDVLLHHGEFDATGVRQVTLALWAYLPCLPACAVSRCLLAGCNALGDVRLTALSSLLAVVFTLAGGAWLLHSMARDIYFCLPAAAASAALWGQTVWLWRGLRRRLRPLLPAPALLDGMACLRHVLAAGAAAAGALIVLRLCGMVCPLQELLSVMPVLLPGLPAMAGLALSIGAGCCAWGSALVLLGDADTRMLAHKLRTKLQGDSRS